MNLSELLKMYDFTGRSMVITGGTGVLCGAMAKSLVGCGANVAILARNVEGEFCFSEDVVTVTLRPPWRARLADPGRAVAAALAEVPGANVLTHVQVRTRIEQYLLFQRICSIVVGNAGRIE